MKVQEPYNILIDQLTRSRLVPFLGAGASLREYTVSTPPHNSSESLPTAKGLADRLARELGINPVELGANSLLEVASYYELYVGRAVLQEKLRSIFLHDYEPGSIHRFLASIPNPILIITTNYDRLLERAFIENRKPYHLLVTPAARHDLENKFLCWEHGSDQPQVVSSDKLWLSLEDTSVIFKIHGSVDPTNIDMDSFVITEEDYFAMAGRFFGRSLIPTCIHPYLDRSHILFLGYSLRDIHMRHVIKQMPMTYRHFAIVKDISRIESYMWQKLGVDAYKMQIDDFVAAMSSAMQDLTPHDDAI